MSVTVTDRYKEQATKAGKAPPVVTEVEAFKQFSGMVVSGSGTTIRVAGDATSFFSSGDTVCVLARGISVEYPIASAPSYSSGDDWTSLVLTGFTYDADEDLYNFVGLKFPLTPYLADRPIQRIRQSVESQTLNVFDTGSFKVKFLDPDGDLYDEGSQDGFFYSTDLIWITVKLGFKGLTLANERPIIVGGVVDCSGTVWKRDSRTLSVQCYGYMKALDHMGAFESAHTLGPMTNLTGVELVAYYPPADGGEVIYGPKNLAFNFPDGEATTGVDIVQVEDLDMRTGGRIFKYVHPHRYQFDYGPAYLVQDSNDVNSIGDKTLNDYTGSPAVFNFGRPSSLAKNPNYHTADIIWIALEEDGTRSFVKGRATLAFDNGAKVEAIPDFHAVVLYDSNADKWTGYTNEAAIPGEPFDLLNLVDTLYLGDNDRFGGVYFDIADPASGTVSVKIYYSKGPNNWIEIPAGDLEDTTDDFSVSGWIRWQLPDDWRSTTVVDENNPEDDFAWQGLYFIKIVPQTSFTPAACHGLQKIIGLIGKGGDQLSVFVRLSNLPSDSVSQQVIIKHDTDSAGVVAATPATWHQLMSVHGLVEDLLRRGGYPPDIQHIDELKLEVDTAQIFSYGGRCPHLTARHPITSMAYDSATGYLYVGSGLEIWRVKGDTQFERVCLVAKPEYTEPVEGSYTGYNYETTWSDKYQIVRLEHVDVSGHATLRGIAIHPYDEWCWSQYTCPAIAFQYDLIDDVFEVYTVDLAAATTDDYYYGIWPGTHVVRPGRDDHIPGEASGTYQRMMGQFYARGNNQRFGENVSLPFGQLVVGGRYKYNGAQELFTGMQAAAGLCSIGTFFQCLWQFVARAIYTGGGAKGFPWIFLPAGFYSHWDWFPNYTHGEPCRLRYTFGQEGFIEYDAATGGFCMPAQIKGESASPGCYLVWQMRSFWVADETWHNEGLDFLRWYRKGTETQVMCGCLGPDGYRYVGVIQFVEMGSGESSIAATRIISYKDEGFFFTSSGVPGLQRPGKAYVYQPGPGWNDYSADLMYVGGTCPALSTTTSYLYLGLTEQFLRIHITMLTPYVDGTMEIQFWNGTAWETMTATGTGEGYARYFDGTDDLGQNGPIVINPPWNSTDKNRWVAETFYGLTNPGTETEVPNTAEFYWIRIRMSVLTTSFPKIDYVYASAITVWDNWRYDSANHKGYTILNLCDGDSSSSNHIIHGCLWNRDEGTETSVSDPLQYYYFVLDIDSNGIAFTISKVLSDGTDTSNSQFKGHVYDPVSDKVFSLLTHPLYRDRGAILVSAGYNPSTNVITLTRLDNFLAQDWGLSGKLLADGNGRIYGVTYPQGILFHYDTEVYPRVTIADFGQGMSIKQAITYLCEITNTVFRISPDRQAYVQQRDHAVSAGDVVVIDEPDHVVEVGEIGTWPHRYDGVRVQWADVYDRDGTEVAGTTGWSTRVLQISNPFVQDMYVAETMAQVYYDYFKIARDLLTIRLVFMPWITLKDILRFYISSRFSEISNSGRWSASELMLDLKKNGLEMKAIAWDGEET